MQLEVHDGISAVSNFLKTAHLVHPWQLGAIDRVPIDLRRSIFHDQVVLMLQTMHDVVHQSSFRSKLFCCFVAVCPVRIRIPADDVNVFGKFLIVKIIKTCESGGFPPMKFVVTGMFGVNSRNGAISFSKKSIVRSVTKRCQSRFNPSTFESPIDDGEWIWSQLV